LVTNEKNTLILKIGEPSLSDSSLSVLSKDWAVSSGLLAALKQPLYNRIFGDAIPPLDALYVLPALEFQHVFKIIE